MRRAYLFVFSPSLGTQEQVRRCVQGLRSMVYWRYDMPNAFYIVSDSDANSIAVDIIRHFNNDGHFIITQINPNTNDTQGWLPKASWHLINNKTLAPEDQK
jgi:hypothetical protein